MIIRTVIFAFLAALAGAVFVPSVVHAQPLASAVTDYSQVEIYADRESFVPGEATRFALRNKVRDHWHVFWINPGSAGLSLSLNWTLPDGFEAGGIDFPAPEYIPVGPLASYAHEGEPAFVTGVRVPDEAVPGEMVAVEIAAFWQTCEDICVPEDAVFSFALPVLDKSADESGTGRVNADIFAQALDAQPEIYNSEASLRRVGGAYELRVEDWPAGEDGKAFFFPEREGLTNPAGLQPASFEDGALTLRLEPGWAELDDAGPIKGVVSLSGSEGAMRAFAITASRGVDVAGAPTGAAIAQRGAPVLIVLAFLGGIILNAMPCVFPILFVKAASLTASAGQEQGDQRRDGLLYGAGVLATFLLIGGLLLGLRAGGEQLGWGFHLQSPLVVGLSAYILFTVALNLIGVFNVGESVTGVGDGLTRKSGGTGSFFTGVLAVVVAAPCIGPLLTAPVGAAVTQPPAIALLIFAAMAVGLALPYVMVAFVPAIAKALPRPGPWMKTFKQVLSVPVFLAAAYFLWVFARQTQGSVLMLIVIGLILLTAGAWLFEKSKGDGPRAFMMRAGAGLALVLALAPILTAKQVTVVPTTSAYGKIAAIDYDEAILADLRAEGTPVFIDFTAAWCVTCQFNKISTLKTNGVAKIFEETGTVLMVADWTVRDPVITAALERFGAAGVPLYVYYGPDGEPEILPPTLSKGVIKTALQ